MGLSILVFVSAYLPGYKAGGPLRSISNLVEQLGDEFDFFIVTADRDRGEDAAYDTIKPGAWNQVGRAKVRYLSPDEMGISTIIGLLRNTPHDLLYMNSFFNPVFTSLPLLAHRLRLVPKVPVLLAPRGEFSPGALSIHRTKKRLFRLASRALGLHKGIWWQATSELEGRDILREIGERSAGRRLFVAANLPRPAADLAASTPRAAKGPLRLAFLSRIVPKKNLLYALEALRDVSVPVQFTIYGPKEDDSYWRNCDEAIASMPSHVAATYAGAVHADQVVDTLSEHDVFFFPTLGENYGHVIVEALQAGLRLLISDQTPWRDLAACGVGYEFPLSNKRAFADAIEEMANTPFAERVKWRDAAKAYAAGVAAKGNAIADNRNMFLKAMESGK